MQVTKVQKEEGVNLLKVVIVASDYEEKVNDELKKYRRNAEIRGFRKGCVPMGVIKSMYGQSVVADTTYRMASEAAFNYLKENNVDYLADVIPAEEQGAFDFKNNTEHEFVFEYAEAPAYEFALTAKNKVEYPKIKVDAEMHKNFLDNFLRRYGSLKDVDEVVNDEALTAVLDNGEIKVEDAYVGLISLDEEARKAFVGCKVGDKKEVNVNDLYKTPSQRAAILKVDEKELNNINPVFSLEITKIRRFENAAVDENLFKTAFPEGNVKSAEELDAYVDAEIAKGLAGESDYAFALKVKNYVIEKADLKFPKEFLKRWLYTINEGKFEMAEIEKEFDSFLGMYTWNFIQSRIATKENISVEEADLLAEACKLAADQYAQYGLPNPPQDMVEDFAKKILEDKDQKRKVAERVLETKIVDFIKTKVKVVEKEYTVAEFSELAKTL